MITIISIVLLYGWYLTAMWFLRRRRSIREKTGPVFYAIVGVVTGGLVFDVLLNWTVFTAWFLDLPQEPTISMRLKRYRTDRKYWGTRKKRQADYLCSRWLNPYDPDGRHC